jgi:polyisoprenyl-phosphate glycosyltransferase
MRTGRVGKVAAGMLPRSAAARALSVVVPCYNESKGLLELHRRVTAVCVAAMGSDYEIVLVNDGSHDATWKIMMLLAADDPHIVAINLTRNYGHQIALTAGLEHCRGERIFILDADLQDPPELLPQMLSLMDQGAEVVYGERRSRRGERWFKTTATLLFYRLLKRLAEIDIPLDAGDFRLISRRVLDILNAMPEQHRFIRGMVSWMGLKQVPLVYDRDPRFAGETGYPLRKLLALALDGITGFSVVPLRIASYIGMVTGMVGFLMLIYSIGARLFASAPNGWASLMTVMLIIGGAQLFVLGIVGEYLGRLYMESKHRPVYLVDRVIASPDAADLPSHQIARGRREAG